MANRPVGGGRDRSRGVGNGRVELVGPGTELAIVVVLAVRE